MKKTLTFFGLFAILFALASCGGRTAKPITVSQDDDQEKTCRQLIDGLLAMNAGIKKLQPKETTGDFYGSLYKPNVSSNPFFEKFEEADKKEYSAFIRRYEYLGHIAEDNGCRVRLKEYKSVEQMQKALDGK